MLLENAQDRPPGLVLPDDGHGPGNGAQSFKVEKRVSRAAERELAPGVAQDEHRGFPRHPARRPEEIFVQDEVPPDGDGLSAEGLNQALEMYHASSPPPFDSRRAPTG